MSEEENKENDLDSSEEKVKATSTDSPEPQKEKPASPKAESSKPDSPKQDKEDGGESVEKAEVPEKKEETAADLLGANIEQVKIRKAKGSKNVTSGICYVVATFNNTKVSFTDMKGNVISWSSSGKCNFRGSRKSTAYAAQVVTQDAGKVAMSHGMKEVLVKVKGPGMGRDSAIRALQSLGFSV
jgi:small subunit ribosomal protein S11